MRVQTIFIYFTSPSPTLSFQSFIEEVSLYHFDSNTNEACTSASVVQGVVSPMGELGITGLKSIEPMFIAI